MQESRTTPLAGTHVRVRDEPWIVVSTERFDAVDLVQLRGTGADNLGRTRAVLRPFDIIERATPSTRLCSVSRRRLLAGVCAAAATAQPWHECWTAAPADIELRAWQLEPATAVVAGATRVLLADRVGLGKTIQAALIVTELLARGLAERVLVLTPPSLRDQWGRELRERFRLAVDVFDQASLAAAVATLPVGVNPWLSRAVIVSSIDLVKRSEVRTALDGVPFDVLVVDEAHHLTRGSERAAVVADIALRTPWVVLVSATPHSGDDASYQHLERLGSVASDPPIVFRRVPRSDPALARRSRLLAVEPTREERALLTDVQRYVRALARTRSQGDGRRLVASVIARRAASSAEGVMVTLARRLALLGGAPPPETQATLPWEDADADDGEIDDALLATPGLEERAREIDWLTHLTALARAAAARSSKIDVLRRVLRRTQEQLIVFSEYRDVVHIVARGVSDLGAVATLHGGLSPRERRQTVRSFNDGRLRTLVATDAAGEGLNLHHRCRLVVNMELPWMPRRLEQRIGRVDRFGQTRRVHALHLVHAGSFESTVIARLERRRAAAFERSVHTPAVESWTASHQQRWLRHGATPGQRVATGGALYARRGIRMPGGTVMLVFVAALLDGRGRVVRRVLVPVAVSMCPNAPTRARLSRRWLRQLVTCTSIRLALHDALHAECSRTQAVLASTAAPLLRRIEECLATVERQRATAPAWQGSLFDRRAEAGAQRRAQAHADIACHLHRRRDAVAALTAVHAAAPRLLAAWLG